MTTECKECGTDAAAILRVYSAHYQLTNCTDIDHFTIGEFFRELRVKYPLLPFLVEDECAFAHFAGEIDQCERVEIGRCWALRPLQGDGTPTEDARGKIEASLKRRCSQVIPRIPLEDFHSIIESQARDPIAKSLLRQAEWEGIISINNADRVSKSYFKTVTTRGHAAARKFVAVFAELIGLHKSESATSSEHSFVASGFVPNRDINLSIQAVTADFDRARILDLARSIQGHIGDLVVIALLDHANDLRRTLTSQLSSQRVLILDPASLKLIGTSPDPLTAFRHHVLQSFPLKSLSPYRFNGPVTGETFIGRKHEVRQVLETRRTNFCIVGARRIGKTSVLKAVKAEVNQAGSSGDTVAVYLDLTNASTIDRFRWELCQETWNVVDDNKVFDSDVSLDHFGRILKQSNKRFLFLVDEVDDLLKGDDGRELERFMRNLSNGDYARFVLCGYRTLRNRVTDRMSPIYNLCDSIHLGPLNRREGFELVSAPMARMGVSVQHERIFDQIVDEGSTIPWLLQFFCHQLLERLDERGDDRQLTPEDVIHVAQSNEFSSLLTDLVNRDRGMPILERLLVFLHVACEEEALSEREMAEKLDQAVSYVPFTDVRDALDYLTETYILTCKNDKFRFFIPQLKTHLRRQEHDVEYVIRSLAKQLRVQTPG